MPPRRNDKKPVDHQRRSLILRLCDKIDSFLERSAYELDFKAAAKRGVDRFTLVTKEEDHAHLFARVASLYQLPAQIDRDLP
jgi:hypothetical protein